MPVIGTDQAAELADKAFIADDDVTTARAQIVVLTDPAAVTYRDPAISVRLVAKSKNGALPYLGLFSCREQSGAISVQQHSRADVRSRRRTPEISNGHSFEAPLPQFLDDFRMPQEPQSTHDACQTTHIGLDQTKRNRSPSMIHAARKQAR